jgi:hypothetical protein
MMNKIFLSIYIILSLSFCSKQTKPVQKTMDATEYLLKERQYLVNLITKILADRVADREYISKLTGAKFGKDEGASNKFYTVYESIAVINPEAISLLKKVEYREPNTKQSGKRCIVILTLAESQRITQKEVMSWHTAQPELGIPNPSQLADREFFYKYNTKDYNLNYGFPESKNPEDVILRTVVLDYILK